MSRHPGYVRHASLSVNDVDDAIVDDIRNEHGLAFNAAVRYCIRLVGVGRITDPKERGKARRELDTWLADTKAAKRQTVQR